MMYKALAFILFVVTISNNSTAQYLYVTSTLHIDTTTTVDSVRVVSGGTLIADDSITVLGNMTIESGGVLTHSLRLLDGLRINVGTLQIEAGGSIDVSAKGLRGGGNYWTDLLGETYTSTGEIVKAVGENVGGSYGGIGGGSSIGAAYGVIENPNQLGSGGGGQYYYGARGGNGGGLVRIVAGTCMVNGSILANGGSSSNGWHAGFGSGGGIKITTGVLEGSGTIQAVGGYGGENGSGGGGRIAIYYTTKTFPDVNILANGGRTRNGNTTHGSAGTIYLKNEGAYGDLIIDNQDVPSNLYTPLRTNLEIHRSLTMKGRGLLRVESSNTTSFTVEQPVSLLSNTIMWLGSGVTMGVTNASGFDMNVQSGSTLRLDSGSVVDADRWRINGGTLSTGISLSFPNATDIELSGNGIITTFTHAIISVGVFDTTNFKSGLLTISSGTRLDVAADTMTIGPGMNLAKDGIFGVADSISSIHILTGGVLTHSLRLLDGLRINVGTLQIEAGGSIDVSAKGLRGGGNYWTDLLGETYTSSGEVVKAVGENVGGSYGGIGGGSLIGAAYGVIEDPNQLGSGGGGQYYYGARGGNGGGLVRIVAGTCMVNGSILANGGSSSDGWHAGFGSGGGIKITTGVLEGSGTIQAVGGYSGENGSGGGGRIAIYYTTKTFPDVNILANGGRTRNGNTTHGSAGTIYLKNEGEYGDLVIDNGGPSSGPYTPLQTGLITFRNLSIRNGGQLYAESINITSFTVEQPIPIVNTSALWFSNNVTMSVTNNTGFDVNIENGSMLKLDSGSVVIIDSVKIEESSLDVGTNYIMPYNFVRIHDGTINVNGTLTLTNTMVVGSFTINGNLVNNSLIEIGDTIGRITVNGYYLQTSTGALSVDIAGTQAGDTYDQLVVNGTAYFGGLLHVGYLRGFTPPLNSEFEIITYTAMQDTFNQISGWENYGYAYWPRVFKLVAGSSYVNNSTTDPFIILSPAGLFPFKVTLRDSANNPVSGSTDVWLDFSKTSGINGGPSEDQWPFVYPDAPSDGSGLVTFHVNAGGCSSDSLPVRTSHGVIARVPIKSLDITGGLRVTSEDFGKSPCNDYNNDGLVDQKDFDFFDKFVGQTGWSSTVTDAKNFITLEGKTDPEPGHISAGQTIQILAKMENTLNELAVLDEVNYYYSGFGIAQSWTKFATRNNVMIPPNSKLTLSQGFSVPEEGHGCLRIQIFPRYVADMKSKFSRSQGAECLPCTYNKLNITEVFWDSNLYQNFYIPNSCKGETCFECKRGFYQKCGEKTVWKFTWDKTGDCSSFPMQEVIMNYYPDNEKSCGHSFNAGPSWGTSGEGYDNVGFCWDVGDLPCNEECTQRIVQELKVCDKTIAKRVFGWRVKADRTPCLNLLGECVLSVMEPPQTQFFGDVTCKDCPEKNTTLNIDASEKKKTVTSSTKAKGFNSRHGTAVTTSATTSDTTIFQIPVGGEAGDSLRLQIIPFLPNGWSYTISDSDYVHTPDTIVIRVAHDHIIKCGDTARVLVYAYDKDQEFAGYAEARINMTGIKGDLNGSDSVEVQDVSYLSDYLFKFGPEPLSLETAELNNDGLIDIADITRMVDYLYVAHAPFVCTPDTGYVGPEISIATTYNNDTTIISLASSINLKGLQLEFIGRKNVTPENLLGDSIGMTHGSLDSLHHVGLFDFSGGAVIASGTRKVIRIPGDITLLSARASDEEHHSLPVTTGQAIAMEINAGWNMVSNPMTRVADTDSVKQIFPSSLYQHVFAYNPSSGYQKRYNLTNGIGYWGKFAGSSTELIAGGEITLDSIDVQEGWNMIGSISKPVAVSTITSDPPGIRTSDFFEYSRSYLLTNTILPGHGYWVKSEQTGTLILSSGSFASKANRVKIVAINELPPPPPEDISGEVGIPSEYLLQQCYPNPFNPVTVIKYQLPVNSWVRLKIYNLMGQEVETLIDKVQDTGYRNIEWDASNFSSGVYFYRLEATSVADPSRSFTKVMKMLLLK